MTVAELRHTLLQFRDDKRIVFKFENYTDTSKWVYDLKVKTISQEQGEIVVELME
jgi:hypothetical protein